ncbi:sugar transferase [Sphingobium algorifonticola]|uniref:Sugar transferase n=1 Tax=Sphingobium algorifonticola TaxID=2008318 RepID=A0A437J660_9SPHN|nr:sugar transferase [Sphingobium algorifonticola]
MLCLGDVASILVGFLLASRIPLVTASLEQGLFVALIIVPIYGVFAFANQAYSLAAVVSSVASVRSALLSLAATISVVIAGCYAIQMLEHLSRGLVGAGSLISAFLIVINRTGMRHYVRQAHGKGLSSEIVIVDAPLDDVQVSGENIVIARYAGIEPNLNDPLMLHRLGVILRSFDRAVVIAEPERWASWSLLLKGANITGELMMPSINMIRPVGVGRHGTDHTLVVAHGPLALANRAKKRALDLLVTIPALVLLAPLMLLVALAIRLDSPGPIFFKQQRIGRGNRMFNILKFRSMYHNQCDLEGATSASRTDNRITRVGRFIRATSIDELPQLINVLIGDMSLVGPRPHALGSRAGDKLFWEVDPQYWHRHALKPGITGLAQIRGFRGATEQHSDLQNRLNSDLEYVEGWSIWRDLSILIATGMVVVHKNAF